MIRKALAAATLATLGSSLPAFADETIEGRFTFIMASPDKGVATIREAGRDFKQSCGDLAHLQQRLEGEAIENASTSIAFGSEARQRQTLLGRIAAGHETLNNAKKYAENIIDGDKGGQFRYAAQLAKEKEVIFTAQIEAGCFVPDSLKPAP